MERVDVSAVGAVLFTVVSVLGFSCTAVAGVFVVPSSIDNTCARDVTQELAQWLDTVPDGTATAPSVLRFPPGCYRVDGTLEFRNRHHLTLSGPGSELRAVQEIPRGTARAQLQLEEGSDLQVVGLTVRGTNPDGGAYDVGLEHDHNIAIMGSTHVRLDNLKLLNPHGDGVQVSPGGNWDAHGVGAAIPRDIRIRGCQIRSTGRHGVTCTACDRLSVERSTFDLIGYAVFDQEAEAETWPTRHIRLTRNHVGSVHTSLYSGVSGFGFDTSDIRITRNVMTGGRVTCIPAIGIGGTLPVPKHVRIVDNELQSLTGAVFLTNSSDARVVLNRATGQGTCNGPGGGVVLTGGDDIQVTRNVFFDAAEDVEELTPATRVRRGRNRLGRPGG